LQQTNHSAIGVSQYCSLRVFQKLLLFMAVSKLYMSDCQTPKQLYHNTVHDEEVGVLKYIHVWSWISTFCFVIRTHHMIYTRAHAMDKC